MLKMFANGAYLQLYLLVISVWFPCALNMSGCDGNTGCCEGFYWNEDYKNCIKCPIGYIGSNCSIMCEYPSYGEECQNECRSTCPREYCHWSFGCQQLFTTDVSLKDGKEEIMNGPTSFSQATRLVTDSRHRCRESRKLMEYGMTSLIKVFSSNVIINTCRNDSRCGNMFSRTESVERYKHHLLLIVEYNYRKLKMKKLK